MNGRKTAKNGKKRSREREKKSGIKEYKVFYVSAQSEYRVTERV